MWEAQTNRKKQGAILFLTTLVRNTNSCALKSQVNWRQETMANMAILQFVEKTPGNYGHGLSMMKVMVEWWGDSKDLQRLYFLSVVCACRVECCGLTINTAYTDTHTPDGKHCPQKRGTTVKTKLRPVAGGLEMGKNL